eukprot:12003991-Ditylum_brightwellii.AAC.1
MKVHQDRAAAAQRVHNGKEQNNKTTQPPRVSWEAHLNIKADKLATQAKKEITRNAIQAPMALYPGCEGDLIIDRVVITRQLKQSIR